VVHLFRLFGIKPREIVSSGVTEACYGSAGPKLIMNGASILVPVGFESRNTAGCGLPLAPNSPAANSARPPFSSLDSLDTHRFPCWSKAIPRGSSRLSAVVSVTSVEVSVTAGVGLPVAVSWPDVNLTTLPRPLNQIIVVGHPQAALRIECDWFWLVEAAAPVAAENHSGGLRSAGLELRGGKHCYVI
jgi:hypothetical protein